MLPTDCERDSEEQTTTPVISIDLEEDEHESTHDSLSSYARMQRQNELRSSGRAADFAESNESKGYEHDPRREPRSQPPALSPLGGKKYLKVPVSSKLGRQWQAMLARREEKEAQACPEEPTHELHRPPTGDALESNDGSLSAAFDRSNIVSSTLGFIKSSLVRTSLRFLRGPKMDALPRSGTNARDSLRTALGISSNK